jgi:uncharacterized metal-binding protein YceD (DUF177 family)
MVAKRCLIRFGGLSPGVHTFEFDLKKEFFDNPESFGVNDLDLLATVEMEKLSSLMNLHIHIKGKIGVSCDRCLKDFMIPFETRDKLVIKHGDVTESNDQLLAIPHGDAEANIADYLREIVLVALPGKRVPCEIVPDIECDEETLKRLNEFKVENDEKDSDNTLWNELKKIKFNN